MSEELKPCPFCGGKARLQRIGESYYVVCDGYCKIKPTTWDYSVKEKAIKEWNSRSVTEPKLKPCPFCGDTYIRPHIIKGGSYTIGCNTLNCVGLHCEGKLFKSETEAVNAWNRRAKDDDKI